MTEVKQETDRGGSPRSIIEEGERLVNEFRKLRPWEYYGVYDDQRCFFCGTDKRGDNRRNTRG